ncbi:Lipase (class 3) [Ruminococcus sp. YE71]|uniref:lipase family protein n=1 Tax=unclassified Ruminococcus TaxID=2608920 RepID=UPI00088835D2|nr:MULTISPECIES: hypothetical protein [unclassified Ruminococcus]SDA09331.1 Lipase (class 3) [Ruminococcus sp. YE78]SFW12580.1 Lipase (class 3) [Ruminococcus sp. YE71]
MKAMIKTVSIAASVVMLTYSLPFNTFAVDTDDVTKGSFTYMPAFAEEAATEPYFYSDSYFAESSDSLKTHLRTMSMALALSTMEVDGSSYVTDLLSDIGFEDIAIGDMNDKPTKDTIGTAIAHKNIDGQELVAVAIRGSKYDSEWASNLTAGVDGDIKGFSDASKKVNDRIKDYLADNELTDVKLWITGYSRAGAVADLTAVYINEHNAEFKTSSDDLYVYTFEAPAASESDKVYDNIHETRNKNDIINYVYPESWGIHSNGNVQWIGEEMTIVSKTADVGVQGVTVRDAENITKEEFIRQFMDWLSGELTRENFSGDFDGAVSGLLELYFGKTPDERQALADYFGSLKEQFSDAEAIKQNEALMGFLTDDVFFGIFDHNSDKMYEKLTNDLKVILTDMYNAEKTKGNDGLSEEDFNAVLDQLYPLFRQLGPAVVKDMHYHIGMNTDDFLPEDFNDPDYEPGYYEEEEEEPEPVTEAEKGAADGKSAAWVGYSDGLNGEKYASYNDVPDDGEEHTEEYLKAYKQAYKEEYEIQYADGLKDHRTDYQKGIDDGEYRGELAAAQDMENDNEYGTSYNDEPEVYEDSDPYSEEYIQGYKDGYKKGYDIKFKERPLYHVATFALNFDELWSEHQPQYNWELVKSLDSYYTEDTSEPDSSSVPDSSSEPESSSESSPESIPDSSSSIPDSSSAASSADSSSSASSSSKAQSSSQTSSPTKSESNPATGSSVPLAAVTLLMAGIVVSKKKQ